MNPAERFIASQEKQRALDREAFISLWNTINGADAWDKTPWVWVVEFEAMT